MNNDLVLVRHGESEWNKLELFTGWRDPDLTDKGVHEARRAGQLLKKLGMRFDIAFTSELSRAQKTLTLMLDELGQSGIEIVRDMALNERDYGDLSGLKRADAIAKWGAEQVHIWRRSYDIPPPGGESLKDTAARVIPYYTTTILPQLKAGHTILVSAHGNSLRSLIMHLDGMTENEIVKLNLGTGEPYVYRLREDGSVKEKTLLTD